MRSTRGLPGLSSGASAYSAEPLDSNPRATLLLPCSKRARCVDAQALSLVQLAARREIVEIAQLLHAEVVCARDRVQRIALPHRVIDRLGIERGAEVARTDRQVDRVAFARAADVVHRQDRVGGDAEGAGEMF